MASGQLSATSLCLLEPIYRYLLVGYTSIGIHRSLLQALSEHLFCDFSRYWDFELFLSVPLAVKSRGLDLTASKTDFFRLQYSFSLRSGFVSSEGGAQEKIKGMSPIYVDEFLSIIALKEDRSPTYQLEP